jgi:hypothetical protein
MKANFRCVLALAGFAISMQAAAQITLYDDSRFRGQSVTVDQPTGSLERHGFNNRASSAVVNGEAWEVCDGPGFSGRCTVLNPGRHESLRDMNDGITSLRPVSARGAPVTGAPPPPPQGGAQVTFYERHGMQGRSFATDRPIGNFERFGFNDRASSADVNGVPWEVCDGPGFTGRCVVLRPGRYPSLDAMGLNNAVSSARPAGARGPEPVPGGGQLTLYERRDFRGKSINIDRPRRRLERADFANVASSAVVRGGAWEVCDGEEFSGSCIVLRPGRYASLDQVGMNNRITSARPAGAGAPPPGPGPGPGPAVGQVTLYEHSGFRGQSVTVDRPRRNLDRIGAGNSASSVVVAGEPWELCDAPGFGGRCVMLRPGRYQSLGAMGLNDAVSSLRPAQR